MILCMRKRRNIMRNMELFDRLAQSKFRSGFYLKEKIRLMQQTKAEKK